MNFWEAQKRARSRTTLYVVLFLLLTVVVSVLAEFAMQSFLQDSYTPPLPIVGLFFAGTTFATAGVQYLEFNVHGGTYVAEAVGARRVNPNTQNLEERKLLNIVEEIAIASSLPVPPIYILKTPQINAFAAGLSPNDAAVTVTEGTLKRLNRDELQGVIAHEFGHIYNGDMKISMRLAAMCMGFFFVLYIGMRLLQFSGNNRQQGKGNPILVAGLIFMIAGIFTWLFGSILKASVSREREYLADACAVQFTRNPDGIANALRKIAHENETNAMPKTGMAFSHLYFDDKTLIGLFATHPPIQKRIAAIEGREYIPKEWNIP